MNSALASAPIVHCGHSLLHYLMEITSALFTLRSKETVNLFYVGTMASKILRVQFLLQTPYCSRSSDFLPYITFWTRRIRFPRDAHFTIRGTKDHHDGFGVALGSEEV